MKKMNTAMIYIFCALGGLLFGYDTGIISGAICCLWSKNARLFTLTST